MPIELEAALMITSDQPAEVAAQIAELRDLGAFRLVPQPTQSLHDVYFDTPERSLAAGRFGLRVREADTDRRVTLKGEGQSSESGPVARFELELAWQRRNVHQVVGELSRHGIAISGRIRRFDTEPPAAVLGDLGLEAVQRRSTERVRRHVVPVGAASDCVLAELAVDAVRYDFDMRFIVLYEVEIEAVDSDDQELLVMLSEQLCARFGAALRRWSFSKLATGAAIAELDTTAALEGDVHADGTLRPAAIEKIAEHLSRRKL